jgi:hypothetical protein
VVIMPINVIEHLEIRDVECRFKNGESERTNALRAAFGVYAIRQPL